MEETLSQQIEQLRASVDGLKNKQERVIIMIDRSNLDQTFRRVDNSNKRIDYIKLVKFLYGDRFLKQVRVYYSDILDIHEVPEEEKSEWQRRQDFYAFLKHQGYFLHGVRRHLYETGRVEKGLDTALCLHMNNLCRGNFCDTLILVAGDADYRDVVYGAQENYAVKVEVAFFPQQTSRELAYSSTKFIDLLKVKESLLRDPLADGVRQ